MHTGPLLLKNNVLIFTPLLRVVSVVCSVEELLYPVSSTPVDVTTSTQWQMAKSESEKSEYTTGSIPYYEYNTARQ